MNTRSDATYSERLDALEARMKCWDEKCSRGQADHAMIVEADDIMCELDALANSLFSEKDAPVDRNALDEFKEHGGDEIADPVERLRFFCSLAFKNPQDWLDVEPFFDALKTPAPQGAAGADVTGLKRLASQQGQSEIPADAGASVPSAAACPPLDPDAPEPRPYTDEENEAMSLDAAQTLLPDGYEIVKSAPSATAATLFNGAMHGPVLNEDGSVTPSAPASPAGDTPRTGAKAWTFRRMTVGATEAAIDWAKELERELAHSEYTLSLYKARCAELEAARSATGAIPDGWHVWKTYHTIETLAVKGPLGHTAIVNDLGTPPGNVLFKLAKALMASADRGSDAHL